MLVKFFDNPFDTDFSTHEVEAETYGEAVARAGYPEIPLTIYDNGTIKNFPECKNEKIVNKKQISLILVIEGKNTWKWVAGIAAVALFAYGGYVAFTGAWGATTAAATMSSVLTIGSIGVMAAMYAGGAFDQPKDKNNMDNSVGKNAYSLVGGQNQSQLDKVFPTVLGKHLLVPTVVGSYRPQLDNPTSGTGNQDLYVLLNCGIAPLKITNIKIGDTLFAANGSDVRNGTITTLISTFPGSECEIRQDGTIPSLYSDGQPYKTIQINAQIRQDEGETHIITTPKSVNKFTIGFRFNGLNKYNDDGSLGNASVAFEIYYRAAGTTSWKNYNDKILSYQNKWLDKQTARYIDTHSFRVSPFRNIKIGSQLLRASVTSSSGRIKPASYEWTISGMTPGNVNITTFFGDTIWKGGVIGNYPTYTIKNVYSPLNQTTITKSTKSVIRFEHDIIVSDDDLIANPTGQWDIMVKRATIDDREKYTDQLFWDYVVCEQYQKPIMAQKYLDKSCLIAIKVRANEITQNTLQKVSCIAQAVAPVYIGGENPTYTSSDWGGLEPTQDPAALALNILTNNTMSENADDSQIDWAAFVKLHNLCEDKNYSCNMVLSQQESLAQVFSRIFATCRSQFVIKGGTYSVFVDTEQDDPVALLTPKNTSDVSVSIKGGKKIDGYEVTYSDENNGYETTTETIYPHWKDNSDEIDYYLPKLNLPGVTTHNQMFGIIQYMLACNLLRCEMYKVKLPVEHFVLDIGSRVKLAHDVLSVGLSQGVVTNIDGLNITLDEWIQPTDPLKTYTIQISKAQKDAVIDTAVFNCAVEQVVTATKTITLSAAPSSVIEVGDIFAFGETDIESLDCIVVSKDIEESPNLSAVLMLTPYAPDVFTAESETPTPYSPDISIQTFDMNLVLEGQEGEDFVPNGSSVRDDGTNYYDFSDASFDGTLIKNAGTLLDIGDASTSNVETEDVGGVKYIKLSDTNGYVKFLSDVSMYTDFAIACKAKGVVQVSKEVILDFNDPVLGKQFSLFTEGEKLWVEYNGNSKELEVSAEILADGFLFEIDYSETNNQLVIYYEGSVIDTISLSYSYEDVNSETYDYEDDTSETYDTESLASPVSEDADRTKYFWLLNDSTETYPATHFSIAEFHLWAHTFGDQGAYKFYEYGKIIYDAEAVGRYLGVLKEAPTTGLSGDYFDYNGVTNKYFENGGRYYRV